jgi:hypothetical protein
MMSFKSSCIRSRGGLWKMLASAGLFLLLSVTLIAQTSVSSGSIVGTVSDPQDAVVSGARVTITNTGTGQVMTLTSNSAGAFSSGPLAPGAYKVQVSLKGFSSVNIPVTVQVGNTASANAKLQIGQENQIIEVAAEATQVNTEQAIVQGVLTANQIENLPVNGRNFLDLAQLEPGVQIQDGQNFDPTKAGYSSISFGGRFGRTARINLDGIDISDETVGTTTADVPASAIEEFQLSQSSLDLSNDLTSSGAVNVSTKSGTNTMHGEAFGLFRDVRAGGVQAPFGSALPVPPNPYNQRSQYGGGVGGPIIKDKLFYFLDGERTKQDSFAPVAFSAPFTGFSSGYNQAFRENNLLAKANYNLGSNARLFYRYTYFSNSLPSSFGSGLSVFKNTDYSRDHVIGLDFTTGSYTHSVRLSYLKFQNGIVDGVTGTDLPNPGVLLNSGTFFIGPSRLAPQATPQANRQAKYDGSKIFRSHTVRYGVAFNHIQGGGFANFYDLAPRVQWTTNAATEAAANISCGAGPCFPGGSANPLNYTVTTLRVGNGQGFNTESPAFGLPAGGLGPDNRLGLYLGDSWKIKPNFTLSVGLRYDRDTGRTDSDLPAIPEINDAFPGFGNPVKQANTNLAPQLGFAWDPFKTGKTSIRGGIGLYYENVIYNNVLFDRPLRLRNGAFNTVSFACATSTANPVPIAGNTTISPVGICGSVIGNVIPDIIAFGNAVKAGNPTDLQAANPNFIGPLLDAGLGSAGGLGLFDPKYKSPRSVQMNFGIQREIRNGMVFSADYLRNIETHSLLGTDINRDGSVANFNAAGAAAAIDATNGAHGCGTGLAGIDCAIGDGATIDEYASNGLGSAADVGGIGCTLANQTVANGGNGVNISGLPCAFGGKNPGQAAFLMLQPIGRSEYNALQMKLAQNVAHPFKGVKALNFQIAYSLSRLNSDGGAAITGQSADSDQDFITPSPDYDHPGRYFGPTLLDRTHQLSFGGFVDAPGGFRIGLISHFYSPLSQSIIANVSGNVGDIFLNDFTGDGTIGDPVPGTHLGQFDRGTNASQLGDLLNNYNTKVAGTVTPAGAKLISSGLITADQLSALGGVAQPYDLPPAGNANFPWLKATDLKLTWRHTFKERYTIEPSVGFYNVFNFANFNLPPTTMNSLLNTAGSINENTTHFVPDHSTPTSIGGVPNDTFRLGNGTGVYSLGAGRQIEFGMRVTF